MNAAWQETKVQNLGTGPLASSINVVGKSLMESQILRGTLSLLKTGVARILPTRHNASDRAGSFSNERPQSYMAPDASHFDVKTQGLSMLPKHAWKGQYIYKALTPGPFYWLT